jgi:acetolactate synthase-1/2/3 large subunit
LLEEKVSVFGTAAPDSEVRRATDMLLSARNPVILAGAGALGADSEIRELAEGWRIPVATTVRSKGILPENHELSLGCVGLYGTNVANKYLRTNVDVLLAVGTSFSEFTTHAWDPRFQPQLGLIQLDIDSWEIGKNYPVAVGLVGDTRLVLGQVLSLMRDGSKKVESGAVETLPRMKREREYFAAPVMQDEGVPLKPQRFMQSLRDALPRDTIMFGDIGNTLPWLEGFFQVLEPNSFHICSSLASMGYGVSAAIGGQLAAPDRPVVCVCGDGDFQMQGLEVATAVNYNIPVKWFILNNQSLAMIRDIQKLMFGGRSIASEFINPDFVKLAEAMGAVGLRIAHPNEIEAVVAEAIGNDRPTVIDVMIDPDEAPSFDARAEAMTRAWGTSAPLYQKLKLIPELLKRM